MPVTHSNTTAYVHTYTSLVTWKRKIPHNMTQPYTFTETHKLIDVPNIIYVVYDIAIDYVFSWAAQVAE